MSNLIFAKNIVKILGVFLFNLLLFCNMAMADSLPSYIIDNMQKEFSGRVVGVNPYNNDQGKLLYEMQVLQESGKVIIILIDGVTYNVVKVTK